MSDPTPPPSQDRKRLILRVRDFLRYRIRAFRDALRLRGTGWWKHRVWRRLVPYRPPAGPLRLHVGSGTERLAGWVNIDLQPLTEVDVCADVTRTFPYSGVHRIYAEHFLEHLEIVDAVDFLARCHESLAESGRLRLSTPNLDWVWQTQYSPAAKSSAGPTDRANQADEADDAARRSRQALGINRCFYGWGHRFLWNRQLLAEALAAAGFVDLSWHEVGESDDPELRSLERHETWPDLPGIQHVLIVEARKGPPRPERLDALRRTLDVEIGSMLGTTHR